MGFLIVYLLIGTLCSLWSGYSLCAHTTYPTWVICCLYAAFFGAWFSPIAVWHWQHYNTLPPQVYNAVSYVSYLLFGAAFLLFALLVVREFAWYTAYICGLKSPSPFAPAAVHTANLLTLAVAVVCCVYGVYAAAKLPQVLHYEYHDARIQRPLRILALSDWHLNRTISPQKIAARVEFFNSLQPDVILLPGDIADDAPEMMHPQLNALKKLQAPLGIYYTLGNHEIYHYAPAWEAAFAALGWRVLHNSGAELEDTGVYIGGVPDSALFSVSVEQAVRRVAADKYRILLSHTPKIMTQIKDDAVDLVVSGHTHGGQIFPFNFITRFGNAGYVSGEYRQGNTTLLLSRGAGYWGPPLRLLAPSDVLLIELQP